MISVEFSSTLFYRLSPIAGSRSDMPSLELLLIALPTVGRQPNAARDVHVRLRCRPRCLHEE